MTDFVQLTRDYHREQQYQPGWFDLLSVVINGMFSNASEQESLIFLRQMGEQLAQRYPVAAAQTVGDLEQGMNQVLARFRWGRVDIAPQGNTLILTHLALPPGDGVMSAERWLAVLAAVLQGLYAGWLRAQGGNPQVSISPEAAERNDMLRFRYQRS